MDPVLHDIVLKRLDADGFLDEHAQYLVMAACEGAGVLAATLDSGSPMQAARPGLTEAACPIHTYLKSVSVEGFRGVGQRMELAVRPGPGLTLVIGRNGSGKSSFAEALEILLTGDNRRWQGRNAAWKEDWRNLHQAHTHIAGDFLLEGDKAPAIVARTWADGEKDVASSNLSVRRVGREPGDLRSLGWAGATQTYRPFLSYNELGSMLDDGPSKLYDALSVVLGLEDLVGAQESLRQERLARDKAIKSVTGQLSALRDELAACPDQRAKVCLSALKGKVWDLEAVESTVISGPESATDDLTRLNRVITCPTPNPATAAQAAADLWEASRAAAAVAGTESDRALQRAVLLEQALRVRHDHGGTDCPVCGTVDILGPGWEVKAQAEVEALRHEAGSADAARRHLQTCQRAALAVIGPAPPAVTNATGLGIDTELAAASQQWAAWTALSGLSDTDELVRRLPEAASQLASAMSQLRAAAEAQVTAREDRWRPLATALAAWLVPARQARDRAARLPDIKAAEDWVKAAAAGIRDERFAPIAGRATEIWSALRGQSNVALQRIRLAVYPQRKVTLDVSVDGVDGAALGVMSQGELHSLALSLFLPRAMLAESPFGFIVIDDPVQSMDPARVEALARVLEDAAKTRQVIVFTHDDRLPEACRRLRVGAEMLQVDRGRGSVVSLTRVDGPVERYLDDARAIARTQELTETVTTRVAGVFCRLALEAACTETVVRRRLGRGESHHDVEALVASAEKLSQKAALALFDDAGRAGDVQPRLASIGQWAVTAYKDANKGSHEALSLPALQNLVDDTKRLAQRFAALP